MKTMLLINHDPDEVSSDRLADTLLEIEGVENVDIFSTEKDDDDDTPPDFTLGSDAAEGDLPEGYRWANEWETETIAAGGKIDHLVVPRTTDSTGVPYTQGEADIAVPIGILTDEPGKITKLTGAYSVHHPGPYPSPKES